MVIAETQVNTACRQPKTTEHVLVFVPFVKHLLVPFDYRHASTGHLPPYVDGFALPPSYYYPFLPSPQILYLDLTPYRQRGLRSIRLAFDRRDVTIASGAKMAAKRYLHVAGFEVTAEDPAAAEWQGIVSLEADGTAEGKADMVERFNGSKGPWEVVREKSALSLLGQLADVCRHGGNGMAQIGKGSKSVVQMPFNYNDNPTM